jgi:hypothetical protein
MERRCDCKRCEGRWEERESIVELLRELSRGYAERKGNDATALQVDVACATLEWAADCIERGDDGQPKARVPEVGEVWRLATGRKRVVRQRHVDAGELGIFLEFVCSRPHEDEDFSYMCGFDWCRCCS